MPAFFIESPRMRRTYSPSSPPASSGTGTYSSMFSSARMGWPAATWPTSGRQPDGLADVPHRGRIAVLGRVLLDEFEDLLLALRQVLGEVHRVELLGQWLHDGANMCSGQ